MTKTTIAFFGTMPYDKATFNEVNEEYGFDIKYYTGNLSHDNISLTRGADAVCVFVNAYHRAKGIFELVARNLNL